MTSPSPGSKWPSKVPCAVGKRGAGLPLPPFPFCKPHRPKEETRSFLLVVFLYCGSFRQGRIRQRQTTKLFGEWPYPHRPVSKLRGTGVPPKRPKNEWVFFWFPFKPAPERGTSTRSPRSAVLHFLGGGSPKTEQSWFP